MSKKYFSISRNNKTSCLLLFFAALIVQLVVLLWAAIVLVLISVCRAPFRLWLELLLAVESLPGLHAVRAVLHADGRLRHLPLPGLDAFRGDPRFPGCLHRGDAGNPAALLQLPEQIHRGHEVCFIIIILQYPHTESPAWSENELLVFEETKQCNSMNHYVFITVRSLSSALSIIYNQSVDNQNKASSINDYDLSWWWVPFYLREPLPSQAALTRKQRLQIIFLHTIINTDTCLLSISGTCRTGNKAGLLTANYYADMTFSPLKFLWKSIC